MGIIFTVRIAEIQLVIKIITEVEVIVLSPGNRIIIACRTPARRVRNIVDIASLVITIAETKFADLGIKLDAVVNIDVDPAILVERLSGRFICRTCGATYHKVFNPTKVAGTCDKCGGHDFYQREDDKPETVKNRLDINIKQGAPILEHYGKLGLVKDVDGQQDIAKVSEAIKAILG